MFRLNHCARVALTAVALAAAEVYAESWAEAVVAVAAKNRATGGLNVTAGPLHSGDKPALFDVDIRGCETLHLIATGVPRHNYGHAIWGEPVVVDGDGNETRLAAVKPASHRVGWNELHTNANYKGDPLYLGRTLADGFWAHANSRICFKLDRKYVRFRAVAGVDRTSQGKGRVRFLVTDAPDRKADGGGDALARRFPAQAGVIRSLSPDWLQTGDVAELDAKIRGLRKRLGALAADVPAGRDVVAKLLELEALHAAQSGLSAITRRIGGIDLVALERAVEHLAATYPEFPARDLFAQLKALGDPAQVAERAAAGDGDALGVAGAMVDLQWRILLGHPGIDFDHVLFVRRKGRTGLPTNYHSNSSIPKTGYDNAIMRLTLRDLGATPERVFQPEKTRFVGDICLHWEADRMLVSMPSDAGRWQAFELKTDGSGLRQVTPEMKQADNYDACYLPDGSFIFASTAPAVAVPCVNGNAHVANFFRMEADGTEVRQLCFDQEHNWTPRVLANGTVLYQRWEYTDTPHSNTRLLMSMNPDGTNQREYYGSNSYWPTSFWYAQPIPGHATKVVGIASGHHGAARVGHMMILDPALGRREGEGVVQQIPGYGKKFEAYVRDPYGSGIYPSFTHPCPINEQCFLVSCQPKGGARGIYLVDVFDNMLLLAEEPGVNLFEPVALRKTATPPVIPSRVKPERKDAIIYLADCYRGPGLAGIPRGTVTHLRLFTYTFGYHGLGGLYGVIGQDGPWDIKRVMGTVPVEPDGSAVFRVPANTPIALQPLDSEGKSLALMRSWMTAMPGETLSCIGCHESQSDTPPATFTAASRKAPAEIAPWYGPERGFAFEREVQPVLDRYCVCCHTGAKGQPMDLRAGTMIKDYRTNVAGNGGKKAGKFSTAYANLFPYVRGPGIESDYHLLTPMEFHPDTTEVVQLLRKGHYNVRMDDEAWERLYTWIDMNTPYHGSWTTIVGPDRVEGLEDHRAEMRRLYGNVDVDHDAPLPEPTRHQCVMPAPERPVEPAATTCPGWPFDAAKAKAMQTRPERGLDLGDGVTIPLVYVPAGQYLMGDAKGHRDERRLRVVSIDKPFWMSKHEITNRQFLRFDPDHDSKVAIRSNYQFGQRDLPMSGPDQPVVRVSFNDADGFCRWLSGKSGARCDLPTEKQWEWACRAGSATPFHYGDRDCDFSNYANLADKRISGFAANTNAGRYTSINPIKNPSKYDDFIPKDARFDDGAMITAAVGTYRPNAWGLHDMHGNAAEWTRTAYESEFTGKLEDRVVRGGSWRDRPERATASFRLPYKPYHKVFNVGFRIIVAE